LISLIPDNTNVIELIDHKATGVLRTLMDQCRTPDGTDSSFADAMYKSRGNLDRFEASDLQLDIASLQCCTLLVLSFTTRKAL
jgi:myosin heavy subunit